MGKDKILSHPGKSPKSNNKERGLRSKDFTAKEKITLAVLLLASMTTFMSGAAVAPCLPQMSSAFPNASSTAISLVITLPGLAVAACGFFVGAFADRVGKVRTLALAALIFTLSGSAALVLNSLELILLARLILGVGIAGIAVSTTALISDFFSGEKLASALALQAAAMGAGVLLLETAGGFLSEFGWRAPFWLYTIGVVILLGIALFIREPQKDKARSIITGSNPDKESASSFSERAVVIAVVGGAFCIFLQNITTFTLPGRLPFYVEELGSTSSISGLLLGIHGLCMTIGSLAQGKLAIRWNKSKLLLLCFSLITIGLLIIGFIPSISAAATAAIVAGVGVGLTIPTVLQWMTSVATPQTSGKITGCNTAAVNLGQFSCSLLITPILVATGSSAGLFLVAGVAALALGCIVVPLLAKLK